MKKENQITVRLDPITDPIDQNNIVKKSIADVARIIFSNRKISYQSQNLIFKIF